MTTLALLQAAPPMPGRIVGGWEYIYAAWTLSYASLALYGISLWARWRRSTKEQR